MSDSQAQPCIRPRGILSCFNARLAYSCAVIAASQLNFGMDQSAFSNTQAMVAFKRMFSSYNAETGAYYLETTYLSLLNSIQYIGFAFGLVFGNTTSRWLGRRRALFLRCFWALAGAAILVSARAPTQMIVGRTVAHVYIGMELALVPVLQSELVPAEVRGLAVGTYQSGLLIGSLLMSVICRGTSEIEGHGSWRTPFGLFFIIPSLLAVGVRWVPESPRWLLIKGRPEEALESLRLLRQGPYTRDEIEAEFQAVERSLKNTPEQGRPRELFQGTNLRCTLITLGANVFLQLTGQNFMSNYGAIFIQSLDAVNPFTMSCVNTAVSIAVVLATQLLVDRTGRVPLLVAGAAVQTGALMAMGGLGTVNSPPAAIRNAIVATVTIFGAAVALPTNRLRDLSYGLGALANIAIQFAVALSIPYLIDEPYAGLGSRVGFIFGSTALLALLFSCVCVPECGGKSLEDIDELFSQGTPIRHFGTTRPPLHVAGAVDEEKA